VRRIALAAPPRCQASPSLSINLLAGLFLRLTLGTGAVVGRTHFGPRLQKVQDVERVARIPTARYDPRAPLLLATGESQSRVLVSLGTSRGAAAVARHPAESAHLEGNRPRWWIWSLSHRSCRIPNCGETPADLQCRCCRTRPRRSRGPTRSSPGGATLRGRGGVLARLEELERQYPTVVVAAPALDRFPTHALLSTSRLVVLVADEGRLSPAELRSTLHTLARLNVPVGGVVLEGHENGARV
jgi:hypothetical protein